MCCSCTGCWLTLRRVEREAVSGVQQLGSGAADGVFPSTAAVSWCCNSPSSCWSLSAAVVFGVGRAGLLGSLQPTLAAVGCSGASSLRQQQCVGIHHALCSMAAAVVSWFVLGASFGPLQTGLWLGVVVSALLHCQPAVWMHSCSPCQSRILPAVVMPSCLLSAVCFSVCCFYMRG